MPSNTRPVEWITVAGLDSKMDDMARITLWALRFAIDVSQVIEASSAVMSTSVSTVLVSTSDFAGAGASNSMAPSATAFLHLNRFRGCLDGDFRENRLRSDGIEETDE